MPMQMIKGLQCDMRYDATLIFDLGLTKGTNENECVLDSRRCGKRFACQIHEYTNVMPDYYKEVFAISASGLLGEKTVRVRCFNSAAASK